MMRLDPSHKPLAGVSGLVVAIVPVTILLVLVPFWGSPSPSALQIKSQPHVSRGDSAGPASASSAIPLARPQTEQAQQKPEASQAKNAAAERVLYSVRWAGNGVRKRLSGMPPRFPAGLTGSALVRLELVVAGSGAVRSAKVLTPPLPRCDEPSLREVRQWKFEPLQGKHKNADQRCTVTLSFFKK